LLIKAICCIHANSVRFKNIIHRFDQACFLLLRQKYIMILESSLTNGNAVFHY
jgi:hypothetical protein